uniref:Pvc16 N-terminal domain-containing protein n=1 Tax=Candidatus Kentrum sp. DK TaxID=2126562 RepID=A0A450RV06_9GAMM|nr:MAG: Protein of unknown function (DUF4255) [Candidatus Kentron sp. DK]VFJ55579.1 MAG: Protein of unknown function (DUF4255) [Candidatus Kentron sp. DK]
MIGQVLTFLKNQLNAHFVATGVTSGEDKVAFIDGAVNPLVFAPEAISALLINLEEERVMRSADPYIRAVSSGVNEKIYPDIRLNLYVLFVSRFAQYEQGLDYLSRIIGYFQNYRLLDHENTTGLDDRIEKLVMELVTLPFSEQDKIWHALRTGYHPSVLYRVRMVVFRDEDGVPVPGVEEISTGIEEKDSG